MAQFATAASLGVRLGVTLTVDEQTRADELLELASGVIQDEANQTIERVADDQLTLRGSWESRLRLPERPVVSVAAATLDGVALVEDEDWYLDGDELVRLTAGGWGGPEKELVVVYTHGFDPVPDVIRTVCLEVVVRVWTNPGSVAQEGYGSVQVTYGRATGLTLTAGEQRAVTNAVGRRTAGSVRLR